ncbi:unnamed protein product [Pseudo-nitzschia multistriata]|uniref:R3H domain-containing protein n=1 Tax=Pseudo-nitzschia multistriata TaxID=183589 RepID=A0A448ZKX4_9STRA|nr:unnamed protein product [Pseudo-nitzschia multistriata]
MSVRRFVEAQRELLDLELRAENDGSENDGRRSGVLSRLEASEVSVGLYGRTVVRLVTLSESSSSNNNNNNSSDSETGSEGIRLLPAHRFAVGSEVEIRSSGGSHTGGRTLGGVVCAVSETSVSVALSDRRPPDGKKPKKQSGSGKNNRKNDDSSNDGNGDETSLLESIPLALVPRGSAEVHKKLVAALDRLERHGEGHLIAGPVVRAVFSPPSGEGPSPNRKSNPSPKPAPRCFHPGLDASQREAIAFALDPDRRVALVHGPPGTGKTTTVAELVRQAVHHHGMRVLVTAPSNVAVDNILEKLTEEVGEKGQKQEQEPSSPPLRVVRLGHPARIKPSILKHSLEALVQSSDGTEIVRDVRRELEACLRTVSRDRSGAGGRSGSGRPRKKDALDKRAAYRDIGTLRREVRAREEKVVRELIRSAHVVLATTVGADNRALNSITNPTETDGHTAGDDPGFDLVVIDEAAQALEASCWIPILRGRKVVLAGDHCQLPPTIKSKDPRVAAGLGVTLFERLMDLYRTREREISRMLKIQYRMHHQIADWASSAMYRGELETHESARSRTLGQLVSVRKRLGSEASAGTENLGETTLLLIDTAGCGMHEGETEAGSRFNEGEASIVEKHVRKLLALGVEQHQVAVVTPYNGQVELIRGLLHREFPALEIRSVDGFQGGEKEAVVLSLVRSSDRGGRPGGIGFLRDDRRQNVAVTRARRHLALVCDSDTVSGSPFVESLIEWVGNHGEHRSAIEYLSEDKSSCGNDAGYQDDLEAVERELASLLAEPPPEKTAAGSGPPQRKVPPSARPPCGNRRERNPEPGLRPELVARIEEFAAGGRPGDEMVLGRELSRGDRRLVHELAEQKVLEHRSEGREGVDRRLVLSVPAKPAGAEPAEDREQETDDKDDGDASASDAEPDRAAPGFSVLSADDSDSDQAETGTSLPEPEAATGNALLAQLAKERADRQRQREQQAARPSGPGDSKGSSRQAKRKKKKPKGQRLGGGRNPPPGRGPSKKEKDETLDDDLDDMAFLDAQVARAQNAHGRRVEGSGTAYRTIVHGILNARPEPRHQAPRNARASAALRAKLGEAGKARQKKPKKK